MKLWMSAELDADVDAKYMTALRLIEPKVNALLDGHAFACPWKSWDFIGIAMSDRDAYDEVVKKSKKDMSLEFRLKIDHGKLLKANQTQANLMLIDVLARSVDKMAGLDVGEQDREFLHAALRQVAASA